MKILAYFEQWSVKPGDTVRLAVSTHQPEVRAVLEKLITGPGARGESKVGTVERSDVLDRVLPGRWQETAVGSYAVLPLPLGRPDGSVTVSCWIWPSVPDRDQPQTIWSFPDDGLALVILDGGIELRRNGETVVRNRARIVPRAWLQVACVFGASGVRLHVAPRLAYTPQDKAVATGDPLTSPDGETILLAASGVDQTGSALEPYNGKIDALAIFWRELSETEISALRRDESGPAPDVAWATTSNFTSRSIGLLSGNGGPGELHNGVERAVTGWNWDGRSDSFMDTPNQYGALQFHEDDMVDSNWEYDLEFVLPSSVESGVYAVRLEGGGAVERIPLFVRAMPSERADVLLLMPTNTYLAYGNERLAKLDFSSVMAHKQQLHPDESYLHDHVELGRSCYDTHTDGTVCRYSSSRRPLIHVRPGYPNWLTDSYRHFPVDLYYIEWLEKRGHSYHVGTDEDLEREGKALLGRYKVVITGSHPEYWTREGRGHLENYLHQGGRLMYLGGNGFYWLTTRDPERPWIIEVRRDNSGTRCWDAPAGERGHVYTGEQGGIWKNRGLGPHRLVGIGFSAEGWSQGCGYRRHPASYEGVGAAIFEGIDEEIVGDFGHILDGAVADEIDRFDVSLGSPPHALLLASSTGVGKEYIHVVEEQNVGLPDQGGDALPDIVRSDIVYFPIEGGGAVFSVGSIGLVGSMAWNDFDNNMCRVIDNALKLLLKN